jgi:hypothetical protein
LAQCQLGAPRPTTPHRQPLHWTQIHGSHRHEATEIELDPSVTNRQDGVCLSEAWKPPICSLKDRRKPPSHDSRSGFSAGPRRSVHITFIRAQNMPSPAAHQPPTLMSRLPSATCASSSPHCKHQTLSFTRRFPVQHTLTLSLCLLYSPAKPPLFGANLNSCSCLLLVV